MGKKSKGSDHPCLQKYGVPFFGAAFVPYKEVRSKLSNLQEDHRDSSTDEISDDKSAAVSGTSDHGNYVVLAGGGGEGHSGIPNSIILARFDFDSNSLSAQPVAKLGLGSDCPYRMVVHPGGDGIICALSKSCRLIEWDEVKSAEDHKLVLKASDKVLTPLEDIKQQLALAFNAEGSILAVGGEDGNLRVFKWPGMEVLLHDAQAHSSVKDLSFSPDGKFLISLGRGGPGRVWDVSSSTVVASLQKENDEVFAFCRFSQSDGGHHVLYTAGVKGQRGSIVSWNTTSWKRMGSKQVVRDPISSFNVSSDGKLLSVGTIEGDILVINSRNMQVQNLIRKAHLGMVTTLAFTNDSRALVSASMDSSARVTVIEEKKSGGLSMWVIMFILFAIAVYFLKQEGILPQLLEKTGCTIQM
ncbi:putative Prolactin regulatory element-binding protein [Tripterygium wilfordii]|uniref:Putative Prolactin regulatory element-binding protein n=1 Tax=Tripterygium wilfordii TaxID=458696 RepID=A0A7J7DZY6_TRIWF|nr:SEC12-like protein 2 [Tripterygium wilfordii]KAF5751841.1 putative Prolactin regulatory element-binding protein [Tripterygium wilfordii]